MDKIKFNFKGNYIAGRFEHPIDPNGEWTSKSPADFSDVLGKITYAYSDVDRAVEVATTAFKKWKKKPQAERASLLLKYQKALKDKQDLLSEAIAREVGKPLWEAKTEVATMINKVDVTINESMKLIQNLNLTEVLPGTDGVCRYKPHGVMAVIGPFNFPGHLPTGHIVPALLTGNTVIFKPSEKTPIVGQIVAECFMEAGFDEGVFNLIQGEKEVGRRLVTHAGVNGVLFTGSFEVGMRMKQDTLQQYWKILALEMGGKNSAIVWEDANFDLALADTFFGAFVTSGQRCTATSRIIVHESLIDRFVSTFHEKAKKFTIDHPLKDPFIGSVIDATTVDRYLKFLGIAQREGCEMIMRGKALDLEYKGNYVSPSICLVQKNSIKDIEQSVYQQTELFAPNVCIIPTSNLDHAIELANATQYGLAASVFTASREVYSKCQEDLEAGVINWNKPTVGASSKLPFGGTKKSGNHLPTALSATLYCTYPVASLEAKDEAKESKASMNKYPGTNWDT